MHLAIGDRHARLSPTTALAVHSMKLTRATLLSTGASTILPLIICPPRANSFDFSADGVRRAVVRGAQIADQLDSAWQQVSGEVVPAWQQPQTLSPSNVPPALLDEAFAADVLTLTLDVAAECAGVQSSSLLEKLPAARQEAVFLYQTSPTAQPLNNEPFYGGGAKAAPAGTAVRYFPASLATAVADGASLSNATVFGFESYVRWRVLSDALSSEGRVVPKLQRCFTERLGNALLDGPLKDAAPTLPPAPRAKQSLKSAVEGCGLILGRMQSKGLFTRSELQLSLGSGTDLFDERDWQEGGQTSWQYIVSGSTLVGGSQLAQDRTAATGQGAGLYPGQILTAPIAEYLRRAGIVNRLDEYFLDNRVGKPDPRTFSDPRYYSDTLLEVVAL